LLPVPTGASLTFHCRGGHELRLSDLLPTTTRTLLGEWQREHDGLTALAVNARRNGLIDISDIYRRQAERLESRIRLLQEASLPPDAESKIPGCLAT